MRRDLLKITATDTNHRYIIKTHGCRFDQKCIAAWKTGTVKLYIKFFESNSYHQKRSERFISLP